MVSVLHILFLASALQKDAFITHLTAKETRAQRDGISCLRLLSWQNLDSELELEPIQHACTTLRVVSKLLDIRITSGTFKRLSANIIPNHK